MPAGSIPITAATVVGSSLTPVASPEGLCSQFSVLESWCLKGWISSRDSNPWWLELQLHPEVPSQVPMHMTGLSKGSCHFFQGGRGLT